MTTQPSRSTKANPSLPAWQDAEVASEEASATWMSLKMGVTCGA